MNGTRGESGVDFMKLYGIIWGNMELIVISMVDMGMCGWCIMDSI